MSPRPFRFAVQTFSAPTGAEWAERARRAEALGYSSLQLADHFLGPGPALDSTNHPLQELAAVPAMAAAAAATESLRIGCRVFCNDYRHPVMLAKEAATLDLLSDGRLELGMGAGWIRAEYEAAGMRFDPPRGAHRSACRVRVASEGALRRCAGRARGRALPSVWVHRRAAPPCRTPHPPLMIGGGSRRVLELAAREADVVSFNLNNRKGVIGPDGVKTSTAEATARKVDWVRQGGGGALRRARARDRRLLHVRDGCARADRRRHGQGDGAQCGGDDAAPARPLRHSRHDLRGAGAPPRGLRHLLPHRARHCTRDLRAPSWREWRGSSHGDDPADGAG